jgi:hypothetical protein
MPMKAKLREPEALAVKPKKVLAAPKPELDLADVHARLDEIEGDLVRLADLCGRIWGEPLASEAAEIVKKRQGKANG